jgi:mannose-6-phosphate isomerase-like protein (cupin superfamily)
VTKNAILIEKLWGNELWIINNERYCVKLLTILPQSAGSLHFHKVKDETFYVLTGACSLELTTRPDKLPRIMRRGDYQQIPPGVAHRFTNHSATFPCEILECSTHHDDADTYRLEPARKL